jgi:hypothetical protein
MRNRHFAIGFSLALILHVAAPLWANDEPASPREAVRAMYAALADGDAKAAAKACISGNLEGPWLDAMADCNAAWVRIHKSAEAKFKDADNVFRVKRPPCALSVDMTKEAKVIENGDAADVQLTAGHRGIQTRKINGVWKVDLMSTFGEKNLSSIHWMQRLTNNSNRVADEIDAGRFQTAAEAQAELRNLNLSGRSDDEPTE